METDKHSIGKRAVLFLVHIPRVARRQRHGRRTIDDEPYYNNYFGVHGMAPNVTALATSMLPPEAPKEEVVAWAIQRADGGRGMGIVMPHFYKNWQVDSLRTLILNGIIWTAKQEVPKNGLRVALPALALFKPAAVEPGRK